jgi:uncharacterized protein YjbI with pentapeptide repeats
VKTKFGEATLLNANAADANFNQVNAFKATVKSTNQKNATLVDVILLQADRRGSWRSLR